MRSRHAIHHAGFVQLILMVVGKMLSLSVKTVVVHNTVKPLMMGKKCRKEG